MRTLTNLLKFVVAVDVVAKGLLSALRLQPEDWAYSSFQRCSNALELGQKLVERLLLSVPRRFVPA